jgi:hypothetical protein
MEKPQGHGDFATLIGRLWTPRELRDIAERLDELERHPGYAYLQALLDARERQLVDRLVVGEAGDIRTTDQILGMCNGLRQGSRAVDSIRYEVQRARALAEQAKAEADAEGVSQ